MQIVETCIFLRGTVMKASSHEKHSKQQWKKKNKKQKVQTHGQGLGRGLAGDMGLNFLFFFCFFGFSMVFCSLAKTSRTQKNKKQKVQTHGQGLGYPHTNQKPKPRNQKTKKPKNQKNPKTKKTKIAHPKGRGSDAECWVLSFCFFW